MTRNAIIWGLCFFAVLVWSAISPKDYFIWLLEVFPALLAALLLLLTRHRFQFTALTYQLILVHCIILMIGGHYTYADVPLFETMKSAFDWQRNNYDKLGHFAQGFVPAIVAREVLIRNRVIKPGRWLFFIVVSICLAVSAFYELIEWWLAVLAGATADAFLSTQGYVWDTQADMAHALISAIAALLLLAKLHDRQLRKL